MPRHYLALLAAVITSLALWGYVILPRFDRVAVMAFAPYEKTNKRAEKMASPVRLQVFEMWETPYYDQLPAPTRETMYQMQKTGCVCKR